MLFVNVGFRAGINFLRPGWFRILDCQAGRASGRSVGPVTFYRWGS